MDSDLCQFILNCLFLIYFGNAILSYSLSVLSALLVPRDPTGGSLYFLTQPRCEAESQSHVVTPTQPI